MSYTLTEQFDQSKLYHLLNNKDEYGAIITKNEDLLKKYLYKSRNNKISVYYKQKNKGRYYADKQLSLQMIPSVIRKTISNNFYIDIDISNCHPVILSNICKKNNIKCDNLNKYILNRDIIIKRVSKLNNISKKEVKKIYLSLLNGGIKDYNKYLKIDNNFKPDYNTINGYVFCELSLPMINFFFKNKLILDLPQGFTPSVQTNISNISSRYMKNNKKENISNNEDEEDNLKDIEEFNITLKQSLNQHKNFLPSSLRSLLRAYEDEEND